MKPYRSWQKIIHSRLVEMLAEKATLLQCTVEFKCSAAAVIRYVRRHKLTTYWRKYIKFSLEQKKDIIKMVEKGIPLLYIANLYKRDYETIRVSVSNWKVKSNYHVAGSKANGRYGKPVSELEIIDNWKVIYNWLRFKYKRVEPDILHDAVNQSSLELRRIPRQPLWLAIWRRIAARRVVDTVREQVGRDGRRKRLAAAGKLSNESATVIDKRVSEDTEQVESMLSKLPVELRRLVELKMHNEPAEAVKLSGLSESTFYRKLNEAYDVIRSMHVLD